MTTSSRLWILGADDPEMQAIERLLVAAGERVYYACPEPRGKDAPARVHPGNAYEAYGTLDARGTFDVGPLADTIYLVECGFRPSHIFQPGTLPVYQDPQAGGPIFFCSSGCEEHIGDIQIVRIDHHRPGDAGYGKPPERFPDGSSLGQVRIALAEAGGWEDLHWAFFPGGGWGLQCGSTAVNGFTAEEAMIAAADHCLEAAYRGRCPGVNPDELMRWRAESRAAFQKRSVEDVLADIEAARQELRAVVAMPCPSCGGLDAGHNCSYHQPAEYADLRGRHIPELPEAACREGIPFLSTVKDRDGREKVVLHAAPPNLVRRFLAGELVSGLHDMYGSPDRGLCGGYLAPRE